MENFFRGETKKSRKRKKNARSTLSFALDDEDAEAESSNSVKELATNGDDDDGDEPPVKRKKLKKNPSVDTSFLPDRDREEAERKERERLRLEWFAMQEQIKKEDIEITYSYWDGSGHRKTVVVSEISAHPFFQKYLTLLLLPTVQKRRRHCNFPRKMSPPNSRTAWSKR